MLGRCFIRSDIDPLGPREADAQCRSQTNDTFARKELLLTPKSPKGWAWLCSKKNVVFQKTRPYSNNAATCPVRL